MAYIHVSRDEEKLAAQDLLRRQKRAYAICACDLGRLADSERWLPALVQDVTKTGRLPHVNRYGILRAKSADSDDGIQICADEGKNAVNPMARVLDRFRKVMLDKNSRDVFGVTAMTHDLLLPPAVIDRSGAERELERLRGMNVPMTLSPEVRAQFMEAAE